MRLSTKGRYAVTAMIDLALHDEVRPVALTDIAETQKISVSYLEQLFARLRKNRLVKGMRGPGGGYRLARPASEVTIAEIIAAVDEQIDMTRCAGKEDCQDGEKCLTHELWADLSKQLYDFLHGITLGQIVQWPAVQKVAVRQEARHGRGVQTTKSVA
ncbi:MAG: Rrf2 family transcriptional regulator [Nitrospira sp.]|nr:Rrf2 family transcriptional regulator [Nitrospira sp.]